MRSKFSWKDFDNMSKILESAGIAILVFGPLTGITLIILGSVIIKIAGVCVIVGSVVTCIYHFSFSMLMNSIKEIMQQLQKADGDRKEENVE